MLWVANSRLDGRYLVSDIARKVLAITSAHIAHAAEHLPEGVDAAVELILATEGRLVFTGLGKSGIVCRKLAATFASTGTPAYFVHSADALHGDLGMIDAVDTVVGISHSGSTTELAVLLERTKRRGAKLVAITGNPKSAIAECADVVVAYSLTEEGGPLNLAPMASTSLALALGDAIAAEVMARKDFSAQQFANVHPSGGLGKRLLTVGEVLDSVPHRKVPRVSGDTPLLDCLTEMSEKRLGLTTVVDGERIGMLSDGDVRRWLEQHGSQGLSATANELATWAPRWIESDHLAAEALGIMEEQKITAVLVRAEDGNLRGVVHLHDLWGLQMI